MVGVPPTSHCNIEFVLVHKFHTSDNILLILNVDYNILNGSAKEYWHISHGKGTYGWPHGDRIPSFHSRAVLYLGGFIF